MIDERAEFLRCRDDYIYFIRKYVKIIHPLQGAIPFDLFPKQEEIATTFMEQQKVVVNKSRQTGVSTIASALVCWILNFQLDKTVIVISKDSDSAKAFIERVRKSWNALPEFLKSKSKKGQRKIFSNKGEDNKKSFALETGSKIEAKAPTEDAGRSEALSLLILDEVAFYPGTIDKIWESAAPTLSRGGKCWAISTPNGCDPEDDGFFFYNLVQGAQEEESNGFVYKSIHWSEAGYDEQWIKKEKASYEKLGKLDAWKQEYELSFHSKRDKAPKFFTEVALKEFEKEIKVPKLETYLWLNPDKTIDDEAIVLQPYSEVGNFDFQTYHFQQTQKEETVDKKELVCYVLKHKSNINGILRIWEESLSNCTYSLGADVASENEGTDLSTIVIINKTTKKIVAEFIGKLDPADFAYIISFLGNKYNAFVVVETNEYGHVTMHELHDKIGYGNLYCRDKNSEVPGWKTTTSTRPLLLHNLTKFTKEYEICSQLWYNEAQVFERNKKGKFEHRSGHHDDILFASALSLVGMEFISEQSEEEEEPQQKNQNHIFSDKMIWKKL